MTDIYSNQNIQGLDLSGANLTGFNFTNTNATNVNFTNANCTNVNFTNTTITNAIFKNTLITGANISTLVFSNVQKGHLLLRAANQTIAAVNNLTSLTPDEFRIIQPAVSIDSIARISTVTVKIPNSQGEGYTVSITPVISQLVCIFVANNQNIIITTGGTNIRTIRSNGTVVQDGNTTLNYLKINSISYRLTVGNADGVIAMIPVDLNVYQVNGSGLGDIVSLNLGSASSTLNMNNNEITNVSSIQGWNVKEITAGTGIGVTATNGSYAITNSAVVRDISAGTGITVSTTGGVATLQNTGVLSVAAASGTPGITATTSNGAVTLQNTGILSINPGVGISVNTSASGVATITNTGVGPTSASVSQNIRDETQSLYEVGALPRKPDYWATNWSTADSTVRSHRDIYVSVDGKVIATATGLGNTGIRYSTNYGTTWGDGNVFSTNLVWSSICGTSNGSKLFAFGRDGTVGTGFTLLLYSSPDQGASWTQITSSVFAFQNAAGIHTINRVRCSGDGTYILANISNVGTQGRSLFSSDGGATWVVKNINTSLGSGFTNGVAMSRSGAVQFITWINDTGNNSKVFRSIDYGATWTEQFGHIAGANWTHIECDATGRYVWATRYLNVNTPDSQGWYSDNYGVGWYQAGIYGIEDVWVSATGQFVAGVSNPQSGISYVAYSTDYGRSFGGVNMTTTTGSSTTYRTINGSADGSILVLGSVNTTEAGFPGDGLIRIARSGVQNIYDIIQSHNVLWYATNIKSSSATNIVSFPISDTYGRINFDTHNIEYEIEINWDRHTFVSPSTHIAIVLNGIYSDPNIHSANTTWLFMLEHATSPLNNGSQGANGYTQHYNNRFYCGYSATQGTGDAFRYRTFLTGHLSVQRRKQAQTVDLGGYSADWSLDSRTLTNRFTSDSYLLQVTSFSTSGPDRARLFSQTDFDNGHHCISGTAIWELTDSGAWNGGQPNDLKDGIYNIMILFVNNTDYAAISRGYDVSARFWRVRK